MADGIMQKEISNLIFSELTNLNTILLSDKNIFKGGNEFRYFDIKSIRYQTEYVKGIDFVNSKLQCLSVSFG